MAGFFVSSGVRQIPAMTSTPRADKAVFRSGRASPGWSQQVTKVTAILPSQPLRACTAALMAGAGFQAQTGVPIMSRSYCETSISEGTISSQAPFRDRRTPVV